MDLREIGQTALGVLILKPDQVLLSSALSNSILFGGLHLNQLSSQSIGMLSLAHTFLMVLGIGLLMGVELTTCIAIAGFVGLGVGAGLFEAGTLLSVFGGQISFISQPLGSMVGFFVVHPYLSDLFIVTPVLLTSVGVFRWHRTKKAHRQKTMTEVHAGLRQYCTACGIHTGPDAKKCKSCGSVLPKHFRKYCTDCGRRVPEEALYCAYCGAELLKGKDYLCHTCENFVSKSNKYCFNCGSRLGTARQDTKQTSYLVR